MCVPSSEQEIPLVVGQVVVRQKIVTQDQLAPGLLLALDILWIRRQILRLLAAVAAVQFSAKAIFPLRRMSASVVR